ncbi:MAG: DNA double-strand break repair nuclease NurA, partial [Caldilineaceae bacterium]
MIERALVWNSLEQKRPNLQAWLARQAAQREAVESRLLQFLGQSAATIDAFLASRGLAWPGARPTAELDQAPTLCLPMGVGFGSQEEWRHWASLQLEGRPVAAVDGSQISPNKEYSPALGAIQVGWFINNHARDGSYTKQVEFEVLTPDELSSEEDDGEGAFAGWYINQQRFVGECRRLELLMQEARDAHDATGAALPLLLFDGSFIISFASQMLPERSALYLAAVRSLLAASKHLRVPLVAFVDTSYSRDLVNLIDLFCNVQGARAVTDAALMDPLLPNWGDRGPLFVCARDDALSREGRADFYPDVLFTYLRTVVDQPPARVEMPRWIL